MSPPRVLVLRGPGTNCDEETVAAWQRAGALAETLHMGRLLEDPVGDLEALRVLAGLPAALQALLQRLRRDGGGLRVPGLGSGAVLLQIDRHVGVDAAGQRRADQEERADDRGPHGNDLPPQGRAPGSPDGIRTRVSTLKG